MVQHDAHVSYYQHWKRGWKCHIVNGNRIGRYSFEWFIGLTARKA